MEYKFWGWKDADARPITNEYKGINTPIDLYNALSSIWCAQTCAPRMRTLWTKENMTLGQCSITAFLVQDIFGGKVYGILRSGGNYHCYNVIGDCKFDLTSEQFGDEVLNYTDNPEQLRETHFAKEEKRLRYEYLKEELRKYCDEKAYQRMTSMEPYHCSPFENPPHLKAKAGRIQNELATLTEADSERRTELLNELFGTYHRLAFPGTGFRCDYGFNIHFHGLAVINYNVVMLDTSPINIGAGAFIGPGVCLACSGHAIHPSQRDRVLTSAPITLEDKVWLGANVTVVGGVTIGEGSVIGAGSVVTRDIPKGVVAAGNPCRVIREITENDIFD